MDDETGVEEARSSFDTLAAIIGNENRNHSIHDFLARPIPLKTFEWTDSTTATTNIYTTGLMVGLKNHNNYSKIVGFRYFRADIEIMIVVNSQPFQQGALLISYFPLGSTDDYQYSQTVSLTGRSGTLSTVLNVEDDAPTTLFIPFNNPSGYIDIVNSPAHMLGTLNVDVYVQSGPGKIHGTVFMRYLNVKLLGPTSELPSTSYLPPNMQLVGQIGENLAAIPLKDTLTEEKEQSETGIVTAVSGAVKVIADALGGIAILKPIMSPLSWVAGYINKVAMYFGWSKPISLHTTTTVKQTASRFMANFNGVDTSDSLALDADNKIDQFAFFGNEDVMSIDSMVSRLNYIGTSDINVGTTAATSILKLPVHPLVGTTFEKTTDSSSKYFMWTSSNMTYLAYIASMFKYWNGTIRFQFRVIKTKFHSGRFLIAWKPGTVGKANVTGVPMSYTVVWDIAKNNTIVVDIPYMNPKPWLQTLDIQAQIEQITTRNIDTHNGTLEISVLNSIVASSDQVKQKINLVTEVAGAPGFNFAFPRDSRVMPVTNLKNETVHSRCTLHPPTNILDSSSDSENDIFVPEHLDGQIGMMVEPISIVPTGSKSIELGAERLSIGEKITSLRQLIKRFVPYFPFGDFDSNKMSTAYNDVRNMFQYTKTLASAKSTVCLVDPTNLAFPPKTTNIPTSSNVNKTIMRADQLTLISGMFAYYRGGFRFKALPVSVSLSSSIENQMFITSLIDSGPYTLATFPKIDPQALVTASNPTILTNRSTGSVIEVQIPYYSKYSYTPCRIKDKLDGPNSPETTQFVMYAYGDRATVNYLPIHYRAAADDFEFLFPIGVPLVQYIHYNIDK